MQRFLEKVCRHISEKHPGNLAEVCIVLPNRRAGLFLKKIFPEITGKTTWSPEIFSIEDFCVHLSGYRPADNLGLLFDFYEIHRRIEGEKAQPFDEFLQWGQLLLKDINEIDMNLVDARTLFAYLTEVKAIEKWNPGSPQLSELMKNYLRFYRSLHDYYLALRSKAETTKEAHIGFIYRQLADTIDSRPPALPWKRIYFAGFNALTKAEKKITAALINQNVAEMLWDADEYYLEDKNQEAGFFMRKELDAADKKNFKWVDNGFKEILKEITVCGTPKNLGQAKYAAAIVKKWVEQAGSSTENANVGDALTSTALVLADENLLFQVLSSLDPKTPPFNVTMGFPIKFTSAYQFFNLLFRLYENASRFLQIDQGQSKGFYYQDMLKLLQHPLLSSFKGFSGAAISIKQARRVFYQPGHLQVFSKDLSDTEQNIFLKITGDLTPSPAKVLEIFDFLIVELRKASVQNHLRGNEEARSMELEYLFHFSKINTRISGLVEQYKSVGQVKTLRKIFDQIVLATKIPFEGEPLQGLQVMGMLETRTLNFDRVILLSANEGILPSTSFGNSFIPLDIQREFGLPVFQEKNAVFAYHFYRLIQNAKEVHLVYNTEPDALGGGEPSRFIHQLLLELPKYQPGHNIHETVISLPVPEISIPEEISIPKENDVFKLLLQKGSSGLSPSSINLYLTCPLRFYFKEIAKISEANEVEENLELQTLGTIVHNALEILYKPYINQQLTAELMAGMFAKSEEAIAAAIAENYSGGDISFGRNRLMSEVIKNFVKSFLIKEKETIQSLKNTGKHITLLDLEQRYQTEVSLPNAENITVKLKGFIDRVDKLDDVVRIIDYKTGNVEANELSFSSWEAFAESDKNGKAFQVLMYAWLYWENHPNGAPKFNSGVISMRKLSEGLISFAIKPGRNADPDMMIDANKLDQFEALMMEILEEIFDKTIPFTQTEVLKTCENCEFRGMCQR